MIKSESFKRCHFTVVKEVLKYLIYVLYFWQISLHNFFFTCAVQQFGIENIAWKY